RHGYHATFMCRPKLPNVMSSGWHLHQSLRKNGVNAFMSEKEDLSETGKEFLAGLLAHARASSALSTPTINGYKRYRPYSLAPDRVIWGKENRGAMLRAGGEPVSLLRFADLLGPRRHRSQARIAALRRHALRGESGSSPPHPERSARRPEKRCLPQK